MKLQPTIYLWFLGFLLLAGSANAQKTWEKPYDKWSKDDALRIVTASPWALTYQSVAGVVAADQLQNARDQRDRVNQGGNGQNSGSAGRSVPPPVVVRLHSGLPIRQAIARGRQIAAGYDKMDDSQKKEYDSSTKGFLECGICSTYYVVSITSFPDSTSQTIQEAVFQNFTLADLKGNVSLVNDKGEHRDLVQFTPPKRSGDSGYLFFARKDDKGNLLLSQENKSFKLLFNSTFFNSSNPYATFVSRTFEFNVSKLMMANELMF